MTSQVNPNNIDGTYPIAGQDNDSQGFRDNFTNIRNNFTYVKAEIEDIQSKAIFKTALNNSTLDNDLAGNVILNAALGSYREVYYNVGAVSVTASISFLNGNFQKITLAGATTLGFTNFPSGQYASIKLWVNVTNISHTLTLPAAVSLGDPDTIAGWASNTITFGIAELLNNENYLFEFYTVDGGTTIGIRDLIRNRDLDLSGLGVVGNLTVDGLTALSNVFLGSSINASVGSNVVVVSNINSTSSTTGALVVPNGGVGIAGNAFVNGNLIINGGIVNPDYLLANVVTDQNLFANVNFNRFIANCSPTGTVANLFITLPNSVEDGRTIDITSMTAITSCFVSNMTPDVTSVYGLANNWSASASLTNSVSIRLIYNTSVGRWFKV